MWGRKVIKDIRKIRILSIAIITILIIGGLPFIFELGSEHSIVKQVVYDCLYRGW